MSRVPMRSLEEFRDKIYHDYNSRILPAELAAKRDSFLKFVKTVEDPYEICEKFPAFKAEMEALMVNSMSDFRRALQQSLQINESIAAEYRETLGRSSIQARRQVAAGLEAKKDRRLAMIAEIQKHVQEVFGYKSFMVTFTAINANSWELHIYVPDIGYDAYYALHNSVAAELCANYRLKREAINIVPHDSELSLY